MSDENVRNFIAITPQMVKSFFGMALRENGDGKICLLYFPYDGEIPSGFTPVVQDLAIPIPPNFYKPDMWIEPMGVVTIESAFGRNSCVAALLGIGEESQHAGKLFVELATQAGDLYHQMFAGSYLIPGPSNSMRNLWASVLYSRLHGTEFVKKHENCATIVSVFAASQAAMNFILDEMEPKQAEPASNPSAHSEANPAKIKRHKRTEARDKWIYNLCREGVAHDAIVIKLKAIAPKRKWVIVSSKQRIQQIGNEYADRNGLPRPQPRREN